MMDLNKILKETELTLEKLEFAKKLIRNEDYMPKELRKIPGMNPDLTLNQMLDLVKNYIKSLKENDEKIL